MTTKIYRVYRDTPLRACGCVMILLSALSYYFRRPDIWTISASICFLLQGIFLLLPRKLLIRFDNDSIEFTQDNTVKFSANWPEILLHQDDQATRVLRNTESGTEYRINIDVLAEISADIAQLDLLLRPNKSS